MLIEDLGTCPNCSYNRSLIRYGSQGYYKFDACPHCTFAFAHNDHDTVEFGQEVWDTIIENYSKILENAGFEKSINGLKLYVETIELDSERTIEHVWVYSQKDLNNSEYYAVTMEEVYKRMMG